MYKYFLLIALFFLCFNAFSQDTIMNGHNVFYYENGKKSSEGPLKNGVPDGYWKTFYENGKIKSEGNRKDFLLDGEWKFYTEEAVIVLSVRYNGGKKHGLKKTYKNGKLKREENYIDDIKEGKSSVFYEDGSLKSKTFYENGRAHGRGKEYSKDGNVITVFDYKRGFLTSREQINRKDKKGLKQGKWVEFYKSGSYKIEGTYRDDKKHGYFKTYFANGNLDNISKYIDGMLQTNVPELAEYELRTDYYASGKEKIVGSYRDNIPEGIRREYDEEGNIVRSFIFLKGRIIAKGIVDAKGYKQGPWEDYYSSGKLKAKGEYLNNVKIKKWVFYFHNGNVEQNGSFTKKGKFTGTWKWYYSNGKLQREESFRNGLEDGILSEYDDMGKEITRGEYIEGFKEGAWFHNMNDHREEGEYINGMRDGEWKYYYETNQLKFKGKYVEDLEDSKHTWYYDNGKVMEEGNYLMGKKEGNWKKYNYDGTLFLITEYKNGYEKKYDGIKITPEVEEDIE